MLNDKYSEFIKFAKIVAIQMFCFVADSNGLLTLLVLSITICKIA
jgi:hypothetical protein